MRRRPCLRLKELERREGALREAEAQLAAERAQLQLEQQRAQAAEEKAHAAAAAAKDQADKAAADCAWARQQQAELTGGWSSGGPGVFPLL